MVIFTDKRLLWTCLLLLFQEGILVSTAGYVNSGLLGSYSSGVLPYYYALSALLSMMMVVFSQKAIRKYPLEYVYWLYLISFFVTIVSFCLTLIKVPGIIFATCTILGVIASVILITVSNSIFLAFDIREFRLVSSRIIITSSIGGILFAIICPLLIMVFGSVVLIILNSLLYLGCLVSSGRLKPLQVTETHVEKGDLSPFSIPIFRLIVACSVFFFASSILLDYSFKLSLKQTFDDNKIAMVTTSFFGMISFLIILTQLFGKKSFVQKYGVLNTLFVLPLLVISFCFFVLIFPNILSIMLLVGVLIVYNSGPCFNAIETLWNVIPRKIQFLAKSQSFIIVSIIGNAILPATILLLLGEKYASIRVVIVIALILMFFSILVLWRIKLKYREHLKTLVEQPRFLQFHSVTLPKSIETEELTELIPEIGHRYSIYDAMLYFKHRDVDPILYLMSGLSRTRDFVNFHARVKMLGKILSKQAEDCLIELLNSKLAVLPNALPMTIAIRSMSELSEQFRKAIEKKLNAESELIISLNQYKLSELPEHFHLEVQSRLQLAIHRFFYYFASLHHARDVLNVLPNILDQIFLKSEQVNKANAIEYLETLTEDSSLRDLLQNTMDPQVFPIKDEKYFEQDPWLLQIKQIKTFIPKGHMNIVEKALFLRRVKLFESLPAEILELIVESLQEESIKSKSLIFSKGDHAHKVYMVVSGTVSIEANGQQLTQIPQYGIFGELGILGNVPRVASAMAQTDVILLSIQKQEFLQLLEDIPEVSKAVIQQLVDYLKDRPE